MRFHGSVYFKTKSFFPGREFLYYPLPYELFATLTKMRELLGEGSNLYWQLYYGIICNGFSALSLLEDNLFGTAYPLCRGAIEIYLKLLILNSRAELFDCYEKFRKFEIEYSCHREYPKEFDELFEQRNHRKSKAKADFLHFGWVDRIDGYHNTVKKIPYSIYGILAFLKGKDEDRVFELGQLEDFYQSCYIM